MFITVSWWQTAFSVPWSGMGVFEEGRWGGGWQAVAAGGWAEREDWLVDWLIDDRFYIALFSALEQTHCARMWFYMSDFFFFFLQGSGVLTALAWLVPHETAAVSAQVLCTPYNHAPCHFMQSHIRKIHTCLAVTCHLHFWQNDRDFLWSGVLTAPAWLVPHETAAVSAQVLCTPYNHAPCHFMQSHLRKVHTCLAVICHLHCWQNDRDLLRATAVTRGWNGYRNKSQHRKLTLERKILPPLP